MGASIISARVRAKVTDHEAHAKARRRRYHSGVELFCPGGRGPLQDCCCPYRSDDATAFRLFRPLAEKGNPGAQFNLGFMYANGRGVPKNYVEALKWYRPAADQGFASAQHNLGIMYANGQGKHSTMSRR